MTSNDGRSETGTEDADDWETADLEPVVKAAAITKKAPGTRKELLQTLRATAPAFRPIPALNSATSGPKGLHDQIAQTVPPGASRNGLASVAATGKERSIFGKIVPPSSAALPPRPSLSASTSASSSSLQAGDLPAATPGKTILLKRQPYSTPRDAASNSAPSASMRPSPCTTSNQSSTSASSITSRSSSPSPSVALSATGRGTGSSEKPTLLPSGREAFTPTSSADSVGGFEAPERIEEDGWDMSRLPADRSSSRQIWTAANASTSSSSIPSLPTGSNTPSLPPPTSLRILRRGNPNDGPASGATSPSSTADRDTEKRKKTLEEREEEYRKARERIFGIEASATIADGRTVTAGASESGSVTLRGGSSMEEAIATALASANADLASGLSSTSGEVVSGSAYKEKAGVTGSKGKARAQDSQDGSRTVTAGSKSDARSISGSRQNGPSPSGSTIDNARKQANSGRRPGRGEGSAFEMLRPPPDSAYRVSTRSQAAQSGYVGSGGGYGGMPQIQPGYGSGVIRQPLGPDDLNSVGFAGSQRYPQSGMAQYSGVGLVGPGSNRTQAGMLPPNYAYGHGMSSDHNQQAAYVQQQQQAQLQLQFQQMQLQGMYTNAGHQQQYGTCGPYDPGIYGQASGTNEQPGDPQPGRRGDYHSAPRDDGPRQGFVQGVAPTGLATSMMPDNDDSAFIVRQHSLQPGGREHAMLGSQADFPALPGRNGRPGTLSSRSSSSSGSRGGGARRQPKAWVPSS